MLQMIEKHWEQNPRARPPDELLEDYDGDFDYDWDEDFEPPYSDDPIETMEERLPKTAKEVYEELNRGRKRRGPKPKEDRELSEIEQEEAPDDVDEGDSDQPD